MSTDPSRDPTIEPDFKDWTWVLERPCDECGFDARSVRPAEVKNRVYANSRAWQPVLARPDVATRPAVDVWSPLEYACHVRDVHRVFAERVRLMLAEDDPLFANWDQDEAAAEGAYAEQDPARVSAELVEAADAASTVYASVEEGWWDRPGRRSNGSVFTTSSLARYHVHDVEHHLHDVAT